MKLSRRQFLTTAAAAATTAATPSWAQSRPIKVRVAYLPVIPSDGHLWLADHFGWWKEQGLDFEYVRFNTGPEQFQAMVGGSIDVLTAGAALANFPARGQGKVFLAGFLERSSTQLWVNPKMGISSIADLKGRQVATTRGTTAEFMLDHALASAKLTAGKDVEVINQPMPGAVAGFITGAVPAVALWVPFDLEVRKRMPEAQKLTDAGSYFPASAVLDGWAAGNEYHQKNPDVLKRIIRGWIRANDYLVVNRAEAIALLHKNRYANLDRATIDAMIDAITAYPTVEWKRLYEDGSVRRWLQQTTDFFARAGNLKDVIPAERYFDGSLFLEVVSSLK